MAYKYVRHQIGEMVDLVQRCVICGHIVQDLRNAMYCGDGKPGGYEPGAILISEGKNPTITMNEKYITNYDELEIENCKA